MAYQDLVIADGAAAYWRLNETSGTTAVDAIAGNNGTISGGVTLNQSSATSALGSSMAFNDGTLDKITTAWSLTLPTAYSMEAWIKCPTSAQRPIVNNYSAGPGNTYFGVDAAGKLFAYLGSATPPNVSSTPVVADNKWHHVVLVVTATQTFMYCDGVLTDTFAQTKPAQVAGTVSIGFAIITSEYWRGSLDEVAIYPTALTPQQILRHYVAAQPQTYANQVILDGASAYWRLNETSGTTAVDSVAGNNGTISGGVTLNVAGPLAGGSRAMRFDGTSGKILVATGAYQTFGTGSLTIECWGRFLATAPHQHFVAMNAGSGGPELFLYATGPLLIGRVTDTVPSTYDSQVSGIAAFVGQWCHLVSVLDRSTNKQQLWINGVPGPATTVPAASSVTSAAGTSLGVQINGVQNFLNGDLAEVAVYKVALTPAQISNHYRMAVYLTNKYDKIGLGIPVSLVSSKVYALPTGMIRLQSTVPVSVSNDGVNFSPLANAETGGARTSAPFISTDSASCVVVAKRR